jgi:hypothetical protein
MITPEVEGINHSNGSEGMVFGVSQRWDWERLTDGHFLIWEENDPEQPVQPRQARMIHFNNIEIEEVFGSDLTEAESDLLNRLIFAKWISRPFQRIRVYGNTWLYLGNPEWYAKRFDAEEKTWKDFYPCGEHARYYPELWKYVASWKRLRPHKGYAPRTEEQMRESKRLVMSEFSGHNLHSHRGKRGIGYEQR